MSTISASLTPCRAAAVAPGRWCLFCPSSPSPLLVQPPVGGGAEGAGQEEVVIRSINTENL